jgi:diaminohydroxyphosphoribosylaminopyrimidine deaminase/5-amino-6-(5-phosphoribosylamino)uracil reductase
LDYCFENQIQSLLVEGGLHTIQSFIDENLWDEARVFSNDKKLMQGIDAPQIKKAPSHSEKIDSDLLTCYFN